MFGRYERELVKSQVFFSIYLRCTTVGIITRRPVLSRTDVVLSVSRVIEGEIKAWLNHRCSGTSGYCMFYRL